MINLTPPTTKLKLVRDNRGALPELYCDVFVNDSDPHEQAAFAKIFTPARCSRADLPEDADFVVFTGGIDVNPSLYDETPHSTVVWDDRRDTSDIEVYKLCLELGIPMVGICRGAQFLHVMNGGKLYQDIDGHNGAHDMFCQRTNRKLSTSSVHHQSCKRNIGGGMEVLATAWKSTERWENATKVCTGSFSDVEAFFYRDTMCLGIQGHPEYGGYGEFTRWFLDRIQDYIIECPDVALKGGCYRIKQDVLDERAKKWAEIVTIPNPSAN